ncbi:flagellar hook-associated protein FlgK [Veronia nyctiphanis]|uniref:Flagellar hook-associated protein 1 n=1 Tax=Veronia nyctiphanis TaxID=1278244 RepID=A0A4Q0YVA5_9GAMM|nr:flagellar hook-associated protein FlgK [Veronia nyctiphanis]RXJ72901.1 flagellar hook-associated protein FlgK [Veronia nyctiphanis]
MGFDLLNLGAQSVMTAQRQLNTTGHNISNVNTEGYSRQTVEQSASDPYYWGGNQWGTGVYAKTVKRNFDQFSVDQLHVATSNLGNAKARDDRLNLIDGIMSGMAGKVPEQMNEFYGAVRTLSDNPGDMGARSVVLEKARMVSNSLNQVNDVLFSRERDTNEEIDVTLDRINGIGKELADIHQSMVNDPTNNDLYDRHQRLINELSEYTQVSVSPRNSGNFNIIIGSGHNLVSGVHSSELTTVPGDPDQHQRRLAMVEGNAVKTIDKSDIRGKLGALFEFRDKILPDTRDELGRVAAGFAIKVNELQEQGFDAYGNVGDLMFRDMNSDQIAASRVVANPSSTADVKVYIDDINVARSGDYQLRFDGAAYSITNPDDQTQSVTPTGVPPSFEIDGLKIQMDSPMSAGDALILRPFRQGAGQIEITMDDPAKIAAQSFISSQSRLSGSGDVKINSVGAQDQFQVVISNDASQYTVLDKDGNTLLTAAAYPPSSPVTVNGTQFELTNGAMPNDVFDINLNPAVGENGNLLKLQALQTDKQMDEGRSSIIDVFEGLNTRIGMLKASAGNQRAVAVTEHDAAQSKVAEVSGVNLDEEAANMMKFQQAYMASSRIMTAANDAFQQLLSATR